MVVKDHFEQMTPEIRKRKRDYYKRIIAIEKRQIFEYNKRGAEMKRGQLAHMIPHWERGLEILEDIMLKNNELKKQ